MTNIFEQANRSKTRFPYRGMCSVEDLWDLPVQDLDSLFKSLNANLKTEQEESLLCPKDDFSSELDLQVAIVRYIVKIKLAEAEDTERAVARKQKNEKILSIIAEKQDAGLIAMSEEELSKMLED